MVLDKRAFKHNTNTEQTRLKDAQRMTPYLIPQRRCREPLRLLLLRVRRSLLIAACAILSLMQLKQIYLCKNYNAIVNIFNPIIFYKHLLYYKKNIIYLICYSLLNCYFLYYLLFKYKKTL